MKTLFILLIILTLPLLAKVNINTASKSELTKLSGIGAAKAQKIINFREFEHKFNTVDDLLKVSGFSEALLEKIKDEIEVGNTTTTKRKTSHRSGNTNMDKINTIMKKFDNEPKIERVQKEALKYAHINNGRFESWISRAKNQAWLPKIYVKGQVRKKNKDDYDQDDLSIGSFSDQGITIENQSYIEAKAEFDLRELVFHPDELRVNKEILTSVKDRKKLLEYITKLYFDRRKNQVNLILSPPRSSKGLLNAKMKIMQQTSILDALTNGYFSKNIK